MSYEEPIREDAENIMANIEVGDEVQEVLE